ncbi:MAG: hypothetical protein ACK5O1_03255 [Holosporales bacterium]|jgi:hypothetical protein
MSSAGLPWSIKGISEEARSLAKVRAAQTGQTIGAWLNETILGHATSEKTTSGNPEGIGEGFSSDTTAILPTGSRLPAATLQKIATLEQGHNKIRQTNEDLLQLTLKLAQRLAALEKIAERFEILEKDTVGFAASFQDQLSDVRTRVQHLEQPSKQQSIAESLTLGAGA